MTTDAQGDTQGSDVGPVDASESSWKSGMFQGALFAALGGVFVFFVIQQYHPYFDNPDLANAFGEYPPEVQADFDQKNAIFILAILGGLVGAGLAVAEGLARKSVVTAIVAGLGCAAVGAGGGALAGYLGDAFHKTKGAATELSAAIQVHGLTMAIVGAGVGVAAAIFLARGKGAAVNCIVGGALAGLLAGVAYPVAAFLVIDTRVLIPSGAASRILWCVIPGLMIGALIPSLAAKKPPKQK